MEVGGSNFELQGKAMNPTICTHRPQKGKQLGAGVV